MTPSGHESVAAPSGGDGGVVDLRPLLARGEDPLPRVLAAVNDLAPEATLQLDAPFDPLPLRRVLSRKGCSSHARRLDEGHWRVTVRRDGRGAVTGEAADGDACGGAEADTPVWQVGEAVHIDVRGLRPPQPMLAILRLLHTLDGPREVIVHHERMPDFLIPELAEMGWMLERIAGEEDEVRLRLTPAGLQR